MALGTADEENGCLWVVPGSNNEPVFPEVEGNIANVHASGAFDIEPVANTSNLDDGVNSLSRVAQQYGEETWLPVVVEPGDVIMCTLTPPRPLHRPTAQRPDPVTGSGCGCGCSGSGSGSGSGCTQPPNRQIRPRTSC